MPPLGLGSPVGSAQDVLQASGQTQKTSGLKGFLLGLRHRLSHFTYRQKENQAQRSLLGESICTPSWNPATCSVTMGPCCSSSVTCANLSVYVYSLVGNSKPHSQVKSCSWIWDTTMNEFWAKLHVFSGLVPRVMQKPAEDAKHAAIMHVPL